MLEPAAMGWLAEMLGAAPSEEAIAASPRSRRRDRLPDALITALDGKFRWRRGSREAAYLAGARYEDGARGHILGIVDAVPGAEADLARVVSEALVFSGLEAGQLDVTFLRAAQPLAATLARHGLRIDLPAPAATGPRRDGDAPPRLR